MKIHEILIPQLEREAALTKKFIKRIPEDKLGWKPHEKSMTIRALANHLAEIPSWITGTMEGGEWDATNYKPLNEDRVEAILKTLEENTAAAKKSLDKPDSEFEKMWKMTKNGETIIEMQKFNALQGMVMNQFPHHRAQLGVYFRLLDISVPSTYGPSADEQ